MKFYISRNGSAQVSTNPEPPHKNAVPTRVHSGITGCEVDVWCVEFNTLEKLAEWAAELKEYFVITQPRDGRPYLVLADSGQPLWGISFYQDNPE